MYPDPTLLRKCKGTCKGLVDTNLIPWASSRHLKNRSNLVVEVVHVLHNQTTISGVMIPNLFQSCAHNRSVYKVSALRKPKGLGSSHEKVGSGCEARVNPERGVHC